MKAWWLNFSARFDALQQRERLLVAIALLGSIAFLSYTLLLEPALISGRQAEQRMADQKQMISNISAQITGSLAPERHPDIKAKAELEELKKQLDDLGVKLKTLESSLVPPSMAAKLLEDVIGKRTSLQLVSLKTLSVTPVLEKKTEEKAEQKNQKENAKVDSEAASNGLFKHGIEIRLQGSYADLTAYLERLEKENMKLLWSSLSLSADKHPDLVLTFVVYTLSMDKTWLTI